jgi:hypothetical protein
MHGLKPVSPSSIEAASRILVTVTVWTRFSAG